MSAMSGASVPSRGEISPTATSSFAISASAFRFSRSVTVDLLVSRAATSMRLEDHLDALVLLVAKQAIGGRRVVERQPVGDDERRIDLTLFDALEQRTQILHDMRLPHLERQPFPECGAEWHLIQESAVDARNGHNPTLPARVNRLPQGRWPIGREIYRGLDLVVVRVEGRAMRLEADRFDAGIGTTACGQLLQPVEHILVLEVDGHDAALARSH